MAEDWQVGDLALCVQGGFGGLSAFKLDGIWYRESYSKVVSGRIYTVRAIKMADNNLGLGFDEVDGPWRADRFRKIRPLSDEERDSFMADLRVPQTGGCLTGLHQPPI